ncbi:MAG: four helix bundle protein [Saprospiraceae bacterium]
MHDFQSLKVWQTAMDLAVEVYEVTKTFPSEEKFELTRQIRKCVVSIASNIAEGAGRNTPGEFNQFLGISNGSCCELQTQLLIAKRLNISDGIIIQNLFEKVESVKKMNSKLQLSLKTKRP